MSGVENNSHVAAMNRRRFMKASVATAAGSAIAALPAQALAMTPEERIRHHLKELQEAFQEHYPDAPRIHATFNETTPEMVATGSVACVIVHTRREGS